MPLDPSIILGGQHVQPVSPLEIVTQVEQLRGLREQGEARRVAAEEARQKAKDAATVRQILTETGGDMEQALPRLRQVVPKAALDFEETIAKTKKETYDGLTHQITARLKGLEYAQGVAGLVAQDPARAPAMRQHLQGLSSEIMPLLPQTDDPAAWDQFGTVLLTAKDRYEQAQHELKQLSEGHVWEAVASSLSRATSQEELDGKIKGFRDDLHVAPGILAQFGTTWSPEYGARAAEVAITPKDRETLAGAAAGRAQTAAHQAVLEGQTAARDAATEKDRAARLAIARQRVAQGTGTDQDAKDIAGAIVAGDQPPTLAGLYSRSGPVRAELARQGYNLANAQLDWSAAQQHFKTLNGAQQTRLRQAVDTAAHSLDVIDTLADQWKGGSFPILNRANLALAKNGAYGAEVATTARQLDAQIADVTAELANAYMGGNSPTDHALELAAKNLSSDWSQKTLKDMTALARTNLRIRQNAIRNIAAAGPSEVNPYAPPAATATPADRDRVIGPNGQTGTVPAGTTLPPGWRKQ
jgi:hypothetical protein